MLVANNAIPLAIPRTAPAAASPRPVRARELSATTVLVAAFGEIDAASAGGSPRPSNTTSPATGNWFWTCPGWSSSAPPATPSCIGCTAVRPVRHGLGAGTRTGSPAADAGLRSRRAAADRAQHRLGGRRPRAQPHQTRLLSTPGPGRLPYFPWDSPGEEVAI